MQIRTTLTEADLRRIARDLSENVRLDVEYKGPGRAGKSNYRVAASVADSRGDLARRSWSGRRGPWLCWHGFRDFFYGIYAEDRDALIVTGIGGGTRYNGLEGFERNYPQTANVNIGSMMQPSYMDENCDC